MAGRTPKVAWGEEWMITSRKISSWEKTRDVRLEASSLTVFALPRAHQGGTGMAWVTTLGEGSKKKHEKTKEGKGRAR